MLHQNGADSEPLCNSLYLMPKRSASHTLAKSYFKPRLISTASALDSYLQDGCISSEGPLYALLARNVSVVQSLQHCSPLHRRLKMPTNHLELLRLTLILNSTPDRFPAHFLSCARTDLTCGSSLSQVGALLLLSRRGTTRR